LSDGGKKTIFFCPGGLTHVFFVQRVFQEKLLEGGKLVKKNVRGGKIVKIYRLRRLKLVKEKNCPMGVKSPRGKKNIHFCPRGVKKSLFCPRGCRNLTFFNEIALTQSEVLRRWGHFSRDI